MKMKKKVCTSGSERARNGRESTFPFIVTVLHTFSPLMQSPVSLVCYHASIRLSHYTKFHKICSESTRFFIRIHIEDVFFTGIVAERLRIRRNGLNYVFHHDSKVFPSFMFNGAIFPFFSLSLSVSLVWCLVSSIFCCRTCGRERWPAVLRETFSSLPSIQ